MHTDIYLPLAVKYLENALSEMDNVIILINEMYCDSFSRKAFETRNVMRKLYREYEELLRGDFPDAPK